MAEIRGLSISLDLDSLQMERGLTGLRDRLKTVNSEMRATMSEFDRSEKSIEKYASQVTHLNEKVDIQARLTKEAKANMEAMVKEYGAGSRQAQSAIRAYNSQERALNDVTRQLNKTKSAMQDLQKEQRETESGWNRLNDSLTNVSNRLSTTADNLTTFGQNMSSTVTPAIAGFGGMAVKSAIDFDKASRRMQAQLGMTAEEAEELNDVARDVWEEGFGESIEEASNNVSILHRALGDLPKEDMDYVTKSAMALADTFDADVNEIAHASSQLMKQFGISGRESFDLIAKGFQEGADTSGEFLSSISEYSTQFKNLGFDADEMMGMFVRGSQSGIFSVDKLADTVKESFLQIIDGSDETTEALEELGLNNDQVVSDIQAGGGKANAAFGMVMSALAGVTDESDKNRLAIALMGTPLEDLGPQYQEFFAQAEEGLKDFEGAAGDATKVLEESLGARASSVWRGFLSDMEPVGLIIIDLAEDILPKISTALQDVATWFDGLGESGQRNVVMFGALLAVAGPMAIMLGGVFRAVSLLMNLFRGGVGILTGFGGRVKQTAFDIFGLGESAKRAKEKADGLDQSTRKAGDGIESMGSRSERNSGRVGKLGGSVQGLFGKMGGLGKMFGGIGKVAGFLGKRLAFLGGPIVGTLATIALPKLIEGGKNLVSHLAGSAIPAVTDFGDKVSDSTTKAVLSYKDMNDNVTTELSMFTLTNKEMSEEGATAIAKSFSDMSTEITSSMKSRFEESKNTLTKYFADSSALTEEEEAKILDNMEKNSAEQQKKVEANQKRIQEILNKASGEKRKLNS